MMAHAIWFGVLCFAVWIALRLGYAMGEETAYDDGHLDGYREGTSAERAKWRRLHLARKP